MKNLNDKKIDDLLLKSGLITYEKLKRLKERQAKTGERMEKLLLTEDFGNYKEVLKLVAGQMGLEFADLENMTVNKEAIKLLTAETARKYSVFPFDMRDNMLYLAMYNPDEIFLIDEIKVYTQMEIKPYLADKRMISKAIGYFYPNVVASNDSKHSDSDKKPCEEINHEGYIDSTIRAIIVKSQKNNASNIHLDCKNNSLRIRYRIDGTLLEDNEKYDISPLDLLVGIKAKAGLLTGDRSLPQKTHMSYELSKKEILPMDIMILPSILGDKIVIKIESHKNSFSMEQLGMSDAERMIAESMISKKSGIILVTGESLSGRTSTVFSLLRKMSERRVNIITIEKKIVEKMQGIHQFQVPKKMEDNLPELLKVIAEHDADVLMVDSDFHSELFRYSAKLALEGKLIILVANYPNIYETVKGMVNAGIEPFLITSSLEGIISQKLVRKVCPRCYKKGAVKLKVQGSLAKHELVCNECSGLGYKGKTGIFEIFQMDNEYRSMIMRKEFDSFLSRLESGISTFKNNCITLINNDVTTIEEIIRLGIGNEIFKN